MEGKCEHCGITAKLFQAGEFSIPNLNLFKKPINLCRKCFDDWGKVWEKTGIYKLHNEKYERAYFKFFWQWFHKEKVNFT
jgi:hypothetical protein